MGFVLPAGVVNTDSVYFYATNAVDSFGPYVKQPSDQTLVVIDYSQLSTMISITSWKFTVDVSSNPNLVVAYPVIGSTGNVLSFLVSGGITGQQYLLSINIHYTSSGSGSSQRTDTLAVSIPSSGDCEVINPVPAIYSQAPLWGGGYINSAVRLFWGYAAPANPNVLDQWYSRVNQILYEYVTDGERAFWSSLSGVSGVSGSAGTTLVISNTPPANPVVGALWFDSLGGQTYLWYNDGTSQQWVSIVNQTGAQ